MRFLPTEEQDALAEAVDDIIGEGGPAAARAWAAGDHGPGLSVWCQLAELGLAGIHVSEDEGGAGGTEVDLVVAFERLGSHALPGPYIESVALLPGLVDDRTRAALIDGSAIGTASAAGVAPLALDTAASTHAFVIEGRSVSPGRASGDPVRSIDRTRLLTRLESSGPAVGVDPATIALGLDRASLAAAAMLLGAGERMLDEAVAYAKVREQFGRPIGEYQALKHKLADVRIALTFARPLLHGAALGFREPGRERAVSAAKVAAGDAATLAARAALQVMGAVGYTEEHDLGLWLTRSRALVGAWGTPAHHRARIARSLRTTEGG